jgi:hypothetical protein
MIFQIESDDDVRQLKEHDRLEALRRLRRNQNRWRMHVR